MKEFRKRLWFEVALCASFLPLIHSSVAYTLDIDKVIATREHSKANVDEDTYTVNFNSISIVEFIRFASKITGLNFVFENDELQFTVTIVSEEPVTAKNVMAALAQVLRMHDLVLLEQDGNVLITKSRTVNAIAPIVSADLPESKDSNSALVTRVFRIKNANVNTIANIIRPMTSQGALIEVSVETRQLIVTDITPNVDQIASLLISLDAPHTPLEVETYVVKYTHPTDLITLTEQILNPFTEGNALIFVPQIDTNSIFIVSTPSLIERAMMIMEDLDIPPKSVIVNNQGIVGKNIFLYKPIHLAPNELLHELKQIAYQMKKTGGAATPLEVALESVHEIKDSASLIFFADTETTTQIKDILTALDTPSAEKTSFYIYKIERAREEQIEESLKQMEGRLKAAPRPDIELIDAINSMRWIKETNSLIFTGTESALKKLAEIVPTFDVSPQQARTSGQAQSKSTFLIYTPEYRDGQDLLDSIEATAKTLQESGLADPSFMQTINSVKWVSSTNSLIFTGDPQSLERIHAMLKEMDSATPFISKNSQVLIYKPKYLSSDQIENALNQLIPSLKKSGTYSDQSLIRAIQSMQWNPDTLSFSVTADPLTIERLKGLLASFDTAQPASERLAKGFFLYKLQSASCEKVMEELKDVSSKLSSSSQNEKLITAIDKIECIKSNNSLLISGSQETLEQLRTLIAEFDVPTGVAVPTGAQSFFIYKAKYLPADEIELAIKSLASDLQASGLNDPALFQSISSMRYVQATDSLVFTGNQETLDKIQTILSGIDTSAVLGAIQHIGNLTFLLYRIQTAAPVKLQASLKSFAENLKQSNAQDKELAQAIESVKYLKDTNSLLFTGTNEALVRVEQILKNFDIPALQGPVPTERAASTFVIYNPKYLTGDELISILCDFMDNLMSSGVSDPGLFDAIKNLKWIPKTSSLLISGDPSSVEKVQQLLVKFDIPSKETATPSIESIDNTSFLVYKLQFHPGNDIQTALRQVAGSLSKGTVPPTALVEAINSLQWVEVTNSLLCTGQQDVLVKLKDLIQNLDVPLRQVFIELLVIQTSLTNSQQFGLQWGGQAQYFNKATLGTGNFAVPSSQGSSTPSTAFANTLQGINATTTPAGGQVPFVSGFDLGVIGDIIMNKGKSFISLGALVNALQLDNDSTILLNPKIITQDNRQSIIFVGQNVPYTGSIVMNQSNSTLTTSNIEYRDVGMSLTITPILGDGDIITMEIVQDISQVTNQATSTQALQLTGITTSHAHMETRVHVPNNYFVALSGMIDDSKTHFKTAIPCLGGLPVIGLLFSENDREATKNNIIIFARPQIINTYEDFKKIAEHQEWLYKDNARLPILKEEFDEGVDLIKLPENE